MAATVCPPIVMLVKRAWASVSLPDQSIARAAACPPSQLQLDDHVLDPMLWRCTAKQLNVLDVRIPGLIKIESQQMPGISDTATIDEPKSVFLSPYQQAFQVGRAYSVRPAFVPRLFNQYFGAARKFFKT